MLRVLAGQGNTQHDLPSLIWNVAMEATEDPDRGAPYKLTTNNEWRLVMPGLAPRRPQWRTAELVVVARVLTGAVAEFGITFRDQGLGLVQPLEEIGDGTIQTVQGTVELPAGGEREAPRLWVRGRATESAADPFLIGSPQTWTGSTTVTQRYIDYTRAQSWNFDELQSGRYELQARTAGGSPIFRRDLRRVFASAAGVVRMVWQRGNISNNPRMLIQSEIAAASAFGAQFDVLVRDRSVDLYAVMLLGGAP
ncbi:MAG: hypothetical protein AAF627_19455 [Myxococcota bacterium]